MVTGAAAAVLVGAMLWPAAAATAATPGVAFSHAVVVDMQRPGFEPDVKVAPTTATKVAPGEIFTSVPFGFSTTDSFVWASKDAGNSYQLTPGSIGAAGGTVAGKPTTCVGGGDTDLALDPAGDLFFSDLQGLTNISNSLSANGGTTWSTNCVGSPNTPDDRMWFADVGSVGAGLRLYQDYDAVDSDAGGGNQLVETVSTDGTTFTPVVNTGTETNPEECLGAGVVDCVTTDEGIPGDQVAVPGGNGDALYLAHNNNDEALAVVSSGVVSTTTPATATWSDTPVSAALCKDPTCVDGSGNAEEIVGENFVTMARDRAGYLYVVFTGAPLDSSGALTAAEQIYVVHSLEPATDPSAVTWSSPTQVTSVGTNTFPWIVAGSDGRVDLAWYHTDTTTDDGLYGATNLADAEWGVQMAQSLDAHAEAPSYPITAVTEHPIKYGQICTNGLGCTTGGDRSLGDFLQIGMDNSGAALVSYVDDTSADTADGENAGPEEISRQIAGPSLLASVGSVSAGKGPGTPTDAVSDPKGDAFYNANGSSTPASSNLDLTGASLTDGPGDTLVATIKVASLASLAVSPTLGGPDASWIIRWTDVTPGATGNGNIYYAGMDNAGGTGAPTFFDGSTSCIPGPGNPAEHCKFLTYPQTNTLSSANASYDPSTGLITLRIPRSDVGNDPVGKVLYSVTAFSATSVTPQSAATIFNLIDATTPFDHTIGAGTGGTPGTTVPESPLALGIPVAALGVAWVVVRRRRR